MSYRGELDRWAKIVKKDRRHNPRRWIYHRAKQRAKLMGIRFTITQSDIPAIPTFCPVLPWIRIRHRTGMGRKAQRTNAPSIDRIDWRRGYVPGNVRIISFRANMLKNTGTQQEFEAILRDLWRSVEARELTGH